VAWFIGLMSGTSLDGVDAVLAETFAGGDDRLWAKAHAHAPFPAALREELLLLNQSGSDEIHRAALAANALVAVYGQVVRAVLDHAGVPAREVTALGAHGQTVRHRPGEFDGTGYTVQLMNGALLAEHTGIDVVCDLRSRDVAAGGQGAPLVPAFHAACFGESGVSKAVLNIGGIANLTLLPSSGEVRGFDTGPGNMLMDLWAQRHLGASRDEGGQWAAGGHVDEDLLARFLADPFFAKAPPKSTGRDLFDAPWLDSRVPASVSAQDVMSTLAELTAASAMDALLSQGQGIGQLLVCGGGAYNAHLMQRLQARGGPMLDVASTLTAGVPPDQVEALAFAWLAQAFIQKQPGNLPAVTGARGPRILGALYRAD
jgi:anhydro-N-acetylmuramic acid kinase